MFDAGEADELVMHPDAAALMLLIRRHNGRGNKFALAAATGKRLKWTLPRFRKARELLVDLGLIVCIDRGGRGKHSPPTFRLT
jgi:hypothetical protein